MNRSVNRSVNRREKRLGRHSHRPAVGIEGALRHLPIPPLADKALPNDTSSSPSGAADAVCMDGRPGRSAEGSDVEDEMFGAATLTLASLVALSWLNQPSTVSSRLLPVTPSKARSATELAAPHRPP
jgi:hypothetical protein